MQQRNAAAFYIIESPTQQAKVNAFSYVSKVRFVRGRRPRSCGGNASVGLGRESTN